MLTRYTVPASTMMDWLRIGGKVRCHNGSVDFRERGCAFRSPALRSRMREKRECGLRSTAPLLNLSCLILKYADKC